MVLIEVCDEQLTELVLAELQHSLEALKQDLKDGRSGLWSHDPKEDRKIIKKHIKALELILEYYGV
jgi:hypothetical protein